MNRRRAFTVIETLVAIGLLILLASALTAFLFDVQRQRDILARIGEERLAGALVIDTLEESVRHATASALSGPAFVGDETSLRITARSTVLATVEPEAEDLSGARTASIAWDEDTGTITIDDEPVTDRVRRLTLRYHDGDQWLDAYRSADTRALPAAIEVTLWFGEVESVEDALDLGPDFPADLGEGFGLPTPADLRALQPDTVWGEPDRRRVIAITRLREDEGV